ENRTFIRSAVHADSKPRKVQQESGGVGFRDTLPAFIHHQDVSHLEPPQAGNDRPTGACLIESQTRIGMVFILKRPARRYRCIKDKRHQDLRPSARADSNSPTVILPVRPRSARMPARAFSISS